MLVLIEGFSLGLSTGVYCLSACAPLVVPFIMAESDRGWGKNAWLVGQFLLGRLVAYILFAIVVSLVGMQFTGPGPVWLMPAAFLAGGLIMLLYTGMRDAPHFGLCAVAAKFLPVSRLPIVLGFVVGINVCVPFVNAMLRVLELRSVGLSVLYFCTFFLGTSVYILPLVLVTPFARIERLKSIGRLACILSGLWFCGVGIAGLMG